MGRNRGHLEAIAVFMVSFFLAVSTGEVITRILPPDMSWHGEFSPPPSRDGIITETDSDHYEIYDVLYYGIGGAIANARKADVIFLGNSRVLHAFRESSVQDASKATGLRFFNLCYPANDGMVMAYETIRRQNLKPAVVAVNLNYFFMKGLSSYGLKTAGEGAWRSRMWLYGRTISWRLSLWLHRFLPRLGLNQTLQAKPSYDDQSSEDGFLEAEYHPSDIEAILVKEPSKFIDPPPEEVENAKWFIGKMAERGIAVVLLDIPYDIGTYWNVQASGGSFKALSLLPENSRPYYRGDKLAEILGLPLIHPYVGPLNTRDGSHLTRESAERYAKGFFKQFLELPVVQSVLKTKSIEKMENTAQKINSSGVHSK